MTLPNTSFDPNLVTNSTLANLIDDKIMAVLTLLADILGVDLGAQRTLNTALASFNTSTGKFETISVEGAPGVHGVIVTDSTNSSTWRITADNSGTYETFYVDKYNGATWDPILEIDEENGVYHYGMAAYLGTSTIDEITAGTGLSGGGTTGTVNIDIENLGVGTAQLADDSVTADKLAANAVVDANVASAAAIDGSKFKDKSIEETKIKTTTITDVNLVLMGNASDGAEWGQVGTDGIGDGVVTTAKLEANCVNTAAMTTEGATNGYVLRASSDPKTPVWGQVPTAGVGDLAVTEGKIYTGAVTVNKIGALAVTDAKIANNTITVSKLAGGSSGYALVGAGLGSSPSFTYLSGTKLTDNTVSLAKIYTTGATDGYVLTATGSGTAPAWEAPPSGFDGAVIRLTRTNYQTINNDSWTAISWTEEDIDNMGWVSLGAGDSTIQVGADGYYFVHAHCQFAYSAETGAEIAAIQLTGDEGHHYDKITFVAGNGLSAGPVVQTSAVMYLTTASTIQVLVYQNTGGSLNTGLGISQIGLHIHKVSD